jgi:hypothetical protein
MIRIVPALALLLGACTGTSPGTPTDTGTTVDTAFCDAAGGASVVATVVAVDQGLGIESIDTTFTSCSDDDLLIHQDCCGLRELRLEKEGPADTWTPIEVASVCDCAFLDPQLLPARGELVFPMEVRDPNLCSTGGGGTYRAVYGIGAVGCDDVACFDELISSTWVDYCEG